MNKSILGLVAVVTTMVAVQASAHHSAAQFDFSKPTTLQGVVKRVEVVNPHTHMLLTITDGRGTRDVDFEGHSASNFFRAGYRRGMMQAGDRISITVAPMRNGADGGFILSFTTKTGRKVGFSPM
ncbi:DUF6152 family protein [Tsuneonella sp. HG222]